MAANYRRASGAIVRVKITPSAAIAARRTLAHGKHLPATLTVLSTSATRRTSAEFPNGIRVIADHERSVFTSYDAGHCFSEPLLSLCPAEPTTALRISHLIRDKSLLAATVNTADADVDKSAKPDEARKPAFYYQQVGRGSDERFFENATNARLPKAAV